VFWFCDGCESFLNNQEGFDINADTWICKNCGFENDITADNIVDVCKDCGAKLPENATRSLCEDCRKLRHEKMVKRLETGSEMAGVVAVVAKVVRDAMQEGDNSLSLNYESLEPDIDYPVCKSCGAKMTEFDGCAWYTCPECGDAVKIVDGVMTWQNEIFGRGIRNSGKTCSNCGKSLDGGSYTAPWENGSNPDGYIKCPYCGFINFQGEGCM
jgi:predicted RNA-binding Zn-ribbon protein involved in translation (DUF1610 family)